MFTFFFFLNPSIEKLQSSLMPPLKKVNFIGILKNKINSNFQLQLIKPSN